ncbi:RNA-binding motif protein, X-linked 2 [Daldinia childiae]|uniref:RNA-binding motif protein, X-linked 2 n=1 Tax=Daldinia childiae TaxID=326645 RepID=UPI0014470CAC|nr:RNA-binding motif protein, X-linked 2 [Daldinia childiae]KAF3055086.1 RNA-binding motif protein, X-linked 2 [Daldinia childiae]
MNQIRAIQALNKREIENGVSPEASWHTDYRDTAFVNFGGLPYELSEGDIITIFSQYGEPVFLKLARDKETGKSKGFGWLKYEDQRSTDLAVDNLGGAEINGRLVRVDHARYKARDDEDPEEFKVGWEDIMRREKAAKGEDVDMEDASEEEEEERRPMIKEEIELAKLIEEHDEDDPMKGFLIEEKKKEVELALKRESGRKRGKDRKDKHRHHHHSHRSKRDDRDTEERDRHRRSRRDETPVAKGSRERDETPRRRNDSRDRERKRRDDDRDRDRRHDKERRDRDNKGKNDKDRREKHSRRYDDEDRDKDREGKSRRSRSRSPRLYRD